MVEYVTQITRGAKINFDVSGKMIKTIVPKIKAC